MPSFKLPKNVTYVLQKLQENKFEAYIVGGCVRDILLKNPPLDFDITTSALPQNIKEIFKNFKLSLDGINQGTVAVKIEEMWIEITTFRIDGKYINSRRPENVTFTNSIIKDLERRDFTINACATDGNIIIDPFNAISDINKRIIKCIGIPSKRFEEDGLRILRAIRFMSVLEFNIEIETKKTMLKCKNCLKKLSKERVKIEFVKTLLGKSAPNAFLEFAELYFIIFKDINITYNHLLKTNAKLDTLNFSENCINSRLAIFFSEIIVYTKDETHIKFISEILAKMNFTKKDIQTILSLIKYSNIDIENNNIALKRLLIKLGETRLEKILNIKKAKFLSDSDFISLKKLESLNKTFRELIKSKPCLFLRDLQISGDNLIEIGITEGKQIGYILKELLEDVINEKIPNEHKILLDIVKKKL